MFFILKNDEIIKNCLDVVRNSYNCTVEIKPYKKGRSNSQNRLYWSLLGIIAKDAGYEIDDLHTAIKVRFLGTSEKFIAGNLVTIPKSTTTLNTREFTELIEKIYALGAEMGIVLPVPAFWGTE